MLVGASEVVDLARRLRDAGLPVGVGQTGCLAEALTLVDARARRQVQLAARATLLCRREDLGLFDQVFDAWWAPEGAAAPRKTPQAPRHDPRAFHGTALKAWMAERARETDPEVEVSREARAASAAELLGRRDFATLTEGELEALRRAIAELRLDLTLRRTRRRVSSRRGDQVDLRRALRTLARWGAVPILRRRARRWKRRPLVVLADVSGSMELYARLVLQFLHGLTRRLAYTETFAFGTRLTRITPALRLTDPDAALREATQGVVDFGGGTRIGESLARFNRQFAGRVLRRGAVVLVVSDGWEVGDVARLRAELTLLKRRCHRLVWLNPMMGSPSFQPLAAGVAAAQELADDCLPIHNLDSLKALGRHLGRLTARKDHSPRRTG
jgi:uncharacterized protein with von Willebrand factor type A (vWA) domain